MRKQNRLLLIGVIVVASVFLIWAFVGKGTPFTTQVPTTQVRTTESPTMEPSTTEPTTMESPTMDPTTTEQPTTEPPSAETAESVSQPPAASAESSAESFAEQSTTAPAAESPAEQSTTAPTAESSTEQSTTAPTVESSTEATPNGCLIVIDAGHQAQGNSEKEPIGPGASEKKAKVASGTKGCVSGLYEYELTLSVAEKLSEELEARGYEVLMVRTSHDVNISNAERAQVANDAGADAFIRIHANGSDNSSASGVETLCQTASNPYNAAYYESSRELSEQLLDGIIGATGAKKRRVVETDNMSGINWCQVPVTIVEMGFMTNEVEDSLMATEEYQFKLAQGMADGLDAYFVKK